VEEVNLASLLEKIPEGFRFPVMKISHSTAFSEATSDMGNDGILAQ
jgi:hypothetical protein